MDKRYEQPEITELFGDKEKTRRWDNTEIAAAKAQQTLGNFPKGVVEAIHSSLRTNPADIDWWHKRDAEINHDLNAYLDERRRHIEPRFRKYLHRDMTSYDTEEPAFTHALYLASSFVLAAFKHLDEAVVKLAKEHRYTLMMGRTHGQGGDLQTFGKRTLTWLRDLRECKVILDQSCRTLSYSKLSGAMGNYIGVGPDVERETLKTLGLEPYYGATQIMPRFLYLQLASALTGFVGVVAKMAEDIQLGARSPRPIYQEPFAKLQKGSSAMPHKRNTIGSEQLIGMFRMALGYLSMIAQNVVTKEERAIEQSCVERVAWPDLLHVTLRSIRAMTKILKGLNVYPDNMMWEIVESRGTYAASKVKEVLKDLGEDYWTDDEDAYLIVQMAAFNIFAPSASDLAFRQQRFDSFEAGTRQLMLLTNGYVQHARAGKPTIREFIPEGRLTVSENLAADQVKVDRWNKTLKQIFADEAKRAEWDRWFMPEVLLSGEAVLYKQILGDGA